MRKVFLERKKLICDYSRSNQKPLTDQITEIASTCAPISESLSNIRTMSETGNLIKEKLFGKVSRTVWNFKEYFQVLFTI